MRDRPISDKEKLTKILEETCVSRSELARRLDVSYKTIYRWLNKCIKPHLAIARCRPIIQGVC